MRSPLSETSVYLLIARKKKPKTQFTTDPKILPKDANIRRSKISEWPAIAIFSNNISEAVGNNVAETKEAAKILK